MPHPSFLVARPCMIHLSVAPGMQIKSHTGITQGGPKQCSTRVLILLPPLLLTTAKPYPGGDISDSQVFKRHMGTY